MSEPLESRTMAEQEKALAEVVGTHAYDTGWRCACDWTGTADEYDTHLSVALLASPALRELLAQAWDEGHRKRQRLGADDCHCSAYSESLADNPYRDQL